MVEALTKLGEAARRAREYISPWAYLSPSDVASNLPGGGIPAAVEPYKQGLRKTAEATQAFREGRWGDAARWYGSGMLDTATAGLSALPEGGALMKLAAILAPAVKYGDAIWTGASHGRARNQMMRDLPDAEIDKAMTEAASGFIDSKRGFVDRNKAFDIARREDQLLPSIMDKRGELDSEMLIGNGRTTLPPVPAELADEYARLQAGARIDAPPEGAMQKLSGIRAFHGSPHDFDRFDMSKIGTGEGAQAYGHGLYFAEAEDVAKGYRDRIAGADWVDKRGVPQQSNNIMEDVVAQLRKDGMGLIDAEEAASFWSTVARDGDKVENLPGYASIKKVLDEKGIRLREKGSMYEVRINADPEHFLDWDKPLSEQAKAALKASPVNDALERRGYSGGIEGFGNRTGADLHDQLAMAFRGPNDPANRTAAAEKLREAGIPGIKYLDAGSRGAGDGTRNYVVFDDKLVEIIRKYGWMPGMAIPAAMALEMQQAQEQSAPQM